MRTTDEKLDKIERTLDIIIDKMEIMQKDISTLQKDVSILQRDVSTLQKDFYTFKKETNRKLDILMEQVSDLTVHKKVTEESFLFHTAQIGNLDIRLMSVERIVHKKTPHASLDPASSAG